MACPHPVQGRAGPPGNSLATGFHTRVLTRVIGSGGCVVKHGVEEIAGDLYRVHPHVYESESAFVVLYGYLTNVNEPAPHSWGSLSESSGLLLRRRFGPSSCNNDDKGTEAAAALLLSYLDCKPGGLPATENLLVLLSELQGQYAFVIYDSERQAVFAARDPSGQEPLYYHIGAAGNVSFTNRPIDVPEAGQSKSSWLELPPGHFVSGKNAKLYQFALTLQELNERELLEQSSPDTQRHSRDGVFFSQRFDAQELFAMDV